MKTALRLWAAMLLIGGAAPPAAQAQQLAAPAVAEPVLLYGKVSDLLPPALVPSYSATLRVVQAGPLTGVVPGTASRPTAAPTVTTPYTVNGATTSSGILVLPRLPATAAAGSTIQTFTILSFNDATLNEGFYVGNNSTGLLTRVTTLPYTYDATTNPDVFFDPANKTGTFTFQWRATNNLNETSNTATYNLPISNAGPLANNLISQIVPAGSPATLLTEPLAATPAAGGTTARTVSTFRITALPAATSGILLYNGTAVTANQNIPASGASQLYFDPAAGFFGTAVFTYAATDNEGVTGASVSYGIPVAKATCGQASTLNFANLPTGQNWETTQSVQIEGVTITASNYTTPNGEANLQIENNSGLPGKTLAWSADYSSSANNASSVDFTFSRALDNFSIALSDIDQVNSAWRDQIQLDGYTANGTLVSLSASDAALAPNGSNVFSSPNQITGQGNANNFGPNSNVVVTFPQPIVRLRLTYRNAEPIANPGGQVMGINSMSWCSVTDVYTRFTAGPVAANVTDNVSYTVEFGNNGPDAATQVARTVTLPAGATNVTVPTGATYTAATRTINFGTAATVASGASASFTFSFTVPTTTGTYEVASTVSTPANENGQTSNNTATRNLVVGDCNQVGSLSYAAATTGIRRGAVNGGTTSSGPTTDAVSGTTTSISYQNYTSSNNSLNTFEVKTDAGVLSGQTLEWQIDTDNTLGTAGSASVTLVFSRAVNNLTLDLQDIDRNTNTANFIDQVEFDGYATLTGGTPATLTAANFTTGTANQFSGGNNRVIGTANSNAGDAAGNLTVRFTTPVRRLVLIYTNGNSPVLGGGADRTQTLGINSISFCAQADMATTVTPVTTPVNAGQTGSFNVNFVNNGPDPATNVIRQVQLPVGLSNVTASNGGTYNATTGIVSYTSVATLASGASANSVISFTAPAAGGSVTASSTTSSSASEGGNTANNSASGTIVVTPVADVTTVVSGPTTILAGRASSTYTATFTNNGPSDATTLPQTVTLPAGVTSVVIPNGATYDATTRVINFGTAAALAAGSSNSFQFSFTAPTTTGNVALVSNTGTATNQGANTAPDQATLTVAVLGVADVATTIAAQTSPVVAGQTGQFNVTFTNNGPNTANTVTRQVQLPAGLTGVAATNGGTYDAATGIVSYPATATLASGTSLTSVITFTTPATGGSVTATSSIRTTDNEQGMLNNNSQSAVIAVTPAFDVATSITGPTSTVAGTMTTFTVLTRNNGPSVATSVAQTVQLPANLSGVYVSNGGTYNSTTGVVTFPTLPTLSSGQSFNNTISFLAPTTGFTATAAVTPTTGDTAPANNSASAAATTITPAPTASANLFTTIAASASVVAPGTSVTFTVTQGNDGPNPATNVVQTVSLPAGLTGVVVSGGGTYNSTTGVVTFPAIASQLSGTNTQYTITAPAPASGVMMAGASVAAGTTDPMPANNVATSSVSISPLTNVATTLSGPSTATAGQTLAYTVTTANISQVPAANVVQTVLLSAGLTGVTVSGGGTYNSTTGVVTFPAITSQLPGASVSNTITYTAPSEGPLNNVALVTTATAETSTANNSAAITTSLDALSDVTVSISGPSLIAVGNPVAYSVTTTNNGPSAATSSATTVQLPSGLTGVTVSGGGTYNSSTGVVTFPVLASQLAGTTGAVTNTISFIAPTTNQLLATANVTATNEEVTSNNSASASTTVLPATAQTVDLATTITASNASRTPGQSVTFTVTTSNSATNTSTATAVSQQVLLPAGLTGVVVSGGGTYNSTTGVVTFPAIASQAAGASVTNTITVTAPATGPLTATAIISSEETDNRTTNNVASVSVAVTAQADVTTTVTGPASISPGASVTYNVLTLNNGPSPAASVAQTVQLPAGLAGVVVSGGGSYNSTSGLVTFPTLSSLPAGSSNGVTHTVSFTAPVAAFTVVGSVTTSTAETTTANNTSTQNTAMTNQPPMANAVVNLLTTPAGNTAGPQLISALNGSDADGTISSYTITALPTAAQGVLSYNGSPVTIGQSIPATDANKLFFDPAAGFVGNAFFTYTATDNGGATSAAASYTLPVGQDLNSVYTNAPVKGGTSATAYQNNDPISAVFDVNGGRYSSTGAILSNGLPTTGTNATTTTAGATQLATLGLALNPSTGLIYVADRTKLLAGTYTVPVTTVDMYGGTNTQNVSFTIGNRPLPVTLVAFTAQAVGQDAKLVWRTSQELNNRHFVVERSLNGGASFQALGQVKGQGTTSQAHDYAYTDARVGATASATVYYRLRQVDTDGSSTLSDVAVVQFAAPVSVGVYPSPATTQATLDLRSLAEGTYQIQVLDATGRVIYTTAARGAQQLELPVQGWPTGAYVVRVQSGQGATTTLRFSKE
ncbi:DUF11 domain-containing protein [Hymenobacter sp. HSC-4F20]|uniref:T9SS type A sorting domain-containing protein n=1 Tax=Hymenobacter sp. HSC-4F20 TaxID=2864135 RepID=UPI001C72EB24|nr:T9SS type A sorting domain-containing protein [Hymenobacter sp. HSC-4F20]MBX0291681.1 DUF11 domain-containing protein [Hymenobacter sp. HSC-4F20]